jgi:GAF domain-containing protein
MSTEALRSHKRMLEISYELNSTADLDTLLRIIMDAASELTSCDSASVLLLNPRTRDLYFAATSQRSSPGLIGMTVPLENSIAGAILLNEEPIIVSDVSQDPRHHKKVGEDLDYEIRSLLGIPMLAEEHKVGVLEAINKIEGEFDQEDVETLTTLGNLAAVAIHKAALITQLQDANEQLSQLDQLKSDFIAIASHELRTPLAVILGYVSLLKEDVGGA